MWDSWWAFLVVVFAVELSECPTFFIRCPFFLFLLFSHFFILFSFFFSFWVFFKHSLFSSLYLFFNYLFFFHFSFILPSIFSFFSHFSFKFFPLIFIFNSLFPSPSLYILSLSFFLSLSPQYSDQISQGKEALWFIKKKRDKNRQKSFLPLTLHNNFFWKRAHPFLLVDFFKISFQLLVLKTGRKS